jgi:muramoyltetrapeptide carboxypeptidase
VIVPRALPRGGTIGICAPAGPVKPERMSAAVAALEGEGFRVVLSPSALSQAGLFSASDDIRRRELEELFVRDDIDAVFCARGGVGSSRLIEKINSDLIIRADKPFLGFSDLTALQWWFSRNGLISFQGPLAVEWEGTVDEKSRRNSLNILSGESAPDLLQGFSTNDIDIIRSGKVSGKLMPGNLTMIATLLGTPFVPDLKNNIMCIEDVAEPAYRIDRLLFHLRNAGVFNQIGALLCGDLSCDHSAEESDNLRRAVTDATLGFDFPVIMNLPFGHGAERLTLPIGAEVEFDSQTITLRPLQPLVRVV